MARRTPRPCQSPYCDTQVGASDEYSMELVQVQYAAPEWTGRPEPIRRRWYFCGVACLTAWLALSELRHRAREEARP